MAEKKMTKREKYALASAVINGTKIPTDEEIVILNEFFDHEVELLEAKSSKGNAKKNDEQEAFMDVIRDVLVEAPNPMQCGAIAKDERILGFAWKDGKETSSQRVSAILAKMVATGDVVKTIEKKVSYFALA